MSNLGQYLTDHANAGACAANYYNGTHDPGTCRLAAGVCSVIAYLVVELKNAEYQAATAAANSPVPAYVPLSPVPPSVVPPVTTGNDGSHYVPGGGGSGTGGSLPWNDGSQGVEKR